MICSSISADSSATDAYWKISKRSTLKIVFFVLAGFSQQYWLWCSEMSFCHSLAIAKCNSSIDMKDSFIFLLNAKDSVDAELVFISILVSVQDC